MVLTGNGFDHINILVSNFMFYSRYLPVCCCHRRRRRCRRRRRRRCCILSSSEVIEIYCDLFFVNKAPKHFYLCFSCEFQKECLV
jgi:hypothetical protein